LLKFLCSLEGKRVFYVDPEIAHRILYHAVAEKNLDGTEIACRHVEDRCLGSPKKVGATFASHQAKPGNPFIDKLSILAGVKVPVVINPASKDITIHRAAWAFKPRRQAASGVRQKLELNRSNCLLLHHNCACSDLTAAHDVADFHADKVTATQLASIARSNSARSRKRRRSLR
jgi:hypothetical protein